MSANPSVSLRVGTPRGACPNLDEEAVSASGKVLLCQGGIWTYQGVSDVERIFVNVPIVPSDIGTYKTLIASCPATKRALDGGCALLSGNTYDQAQHLFMDTVATDLSGWYCGYGPLNSYAMDQYYFFGWANAAMSAEVYCGVY